MAPRPENRKTFRLFQARDGGPRAGGAGAAKARGVSIATVRIRAEEAGAGRAMEGASGAPSAAGMQPAAQQGWSLAPPGAGTPPSPRFAATEQIVGVAALAGAM